MSRKNLYSSKIHVQNPAFIEPQFISVQYMDNNILNTLHTLPYPSNYQDPSVDAILHGNIQASYLGIVSKGLNLIQQRIVFNAISNTSNPAVKFTLMPDVSLPPGLTFTQTSITSGVLSGIVLSIPLNRTRYSFLLRITNSNNIHVDRYFFFAIPTVTQELYWDYSNHTHYLGQVNRGGSVNYSLQIVNRLNLPLVYHTFPPLPAGLSIINNSIVGVISSTYVVGEYSFTIQATDGMLSTTIDTFILSVVPNNVISLQSNLIEWQTDSQLGSTYEFLPSHFNILATNPNGQTITYSITPDTQQLPIGISLQSTTGYIVGLCPAVYSSTRYTVSVRATLSTFYKDKEFTFTVLPQYGNKILLTSAVVVEDPIKLELAEVMWQADRIRDELLFRPQADKSFGRTLYPEIFLGARSVSDVQQQNLVNTVHSLEVMMAWYIIGARPDLSDVITTNSTAITLSLSQLNNILYNIRTTGQSVKQALGNTLITTADFNLIEESLNINNTQLNVRLGSLATQRVYSPEEINIYDVVYFNVTDVSQDAGGWLNGIESPVFSDKLVYPVRVYPKSLNNMKQSFFSQFNSLDSITAGLPLAQRSLKWNPVLNVLYTQPGRGQTVMDLLIADGIEEKMRGREFTTGRAIINIVTDAALSHSSLLDHFILDVDYLADSSYSNRLDHFLLDVSQLALTSEPI